MKFDELTENAKDEALQNVMNEEGSYDEISDIIKSTYDSIKKSFEKLGITGIKDAFENESQKDVYRKRRKTPPFRAGDIRREN